MQVRRSEERGYFDHGWLQSFHTFQFGAYVDGPERFRNLRVLNEDWVQPSKGFGEHGHREMEIVTLVLEGALQHRDSIGTGSIIRPGEVQRMTAGRGILHSEFNASDREKVHLLQIWIPPTRLGMAPSYEQASLPPHQGTWGLAAAAPGNKAAVSMHCDAAIRVASLAAGERLDLVTPPQRYAWLHLATGEAQVGTETLRQGDAASFTPASNVSLLAVQPSFLVWFDLA